MPSPFLRFTFGHHARCSTFIRSPTFHLITFFSFVCVRSFSLPTVPGCLVRFDSAYSFVSFLCIFFIDFSLNLMHFLLHSDFAFSSEHYLLFICVQSSVHRYGVRPHSLRSSPRLISTFLSIPLLRCSFRFISPSFCSFRCSDRCDFLLSLYSRSFVLSFLCSRFLHSYHSNFDFRFSPGISTLLRVTFYAIPRFFIHVLRCGIRYVRYGGDSPDLFLFTLFNFIRCSIRSGIRSRCTL